MESINLYAPLVILAALPVVESRYLASTAVTLRSATHKIIGMNAEQGSGVQRGHLDEFRSLIFHCLFYGATANLSDFELREGLRQEAPAIPLEGGDSPQSEWTYDPSQSLNELERLLAAEDTDMDLDSLVT